MDKVSYNSPAKINIFLDIKGKRDDGYHEIFTWMQAVDLCDKITISKSAQDYSTLRSRDTGIPFGKRNLCIKAFETVRDNTDMKKTDTVEISLEKVIPLGSGLGGGSSNAASVINGLDEIFELQLSREKKIELAAMVGSDVPFFLLSGGALAHGRGELLEPLPALPAPLWLVIAKPDFSVSTGEAYKWVKNHKGGKIIAREQIAARLEAGDISFILDNLYNAFEPIISEKYPLLSSIKQQMLEAGCLKAQMTGSGSGMFGICADEASARSAAEKLEPSNDLAFVAACKTL
ncbi:MAG: 4-(cytidine 5'-diphospho)-2-C-methyl-D-erythritol kinase [bacterium]